MEIYVHMYVNGKMRPVETITGMGVGGIKKKGGGGGVQLQYIIKTFANVTVYPQYNINKKEKMS
jgi:hypothetical protein